jgi:diguanylate cyclase (GGDEF)-like protein
MRAFFFPSARAALEGFLSLGTETASPEDVLLIRRARGFGLIGLAVAFLAGFMLGVTHGVVELALAAAGIMGVIIAGLWLTCIRGGRHIRSVTHLGMGGVMSGIVLISIGIGEASEIGVIFPMLMVLVITYVLGVRAALFWTLAAIAGMGITIFFTGFPSGASAHLITAPGLFASRSLALVATFVFAAVERRVADRQSVELEFLARHDSLTGLMNRRAFGERLDGALARCRRYGRRAALLAIDLDGFKPVNDAHGHGIGDEVLCRLAARIAAITRETDAACRMGGDEFVVLVEDVAEDKHVESQAKRLLASLMRPVELEECAIELTASIGIAIFPASGEDSESLMRSADRAMYRAKTAGGAAVYCHRPEVDAAADRESDPRTGSPTRD